MKKIIIFVSFFLFNVATYAITNEELEQKYTFQSKIIITQKDFESGTYRISVPGYYQLGESISFYPDRNKEKNRNDKPFIGWFAAITVETDQGVIIDLNGCTLQADQRFVDEHLFNVFADIELDNCPFSGKLFGFPDYNQGFVSFKGDMHYYAAKNVIIKNGILSRSGHWGVHGNNNENIFIHDLIIKDWEVRGIELIGLKKGLIKNVEISGLEHSINTSVPLVGALQVQQMLQKLIKYGFYQAEAQYNKLVNFLEKNPGYLNPAQQLATGTIGGIFLTGAGVSNVGFPVTNALCAHAAAMTDGGITQDVEIENVCVHDIAVNSVQYISIGSNQSGPDGNIIRLEGIGILPGASLFWHDAYDKDGNFAPNEVLRSIMLIARAMIHYQPELKKTVPKNFLKIADSILDADHNQFLKNVQPVFTYPSHKIKGLFGIRIEGAKNVTVKNCTIKNLKSVGSPCQELSEIFDAKYFTPNRHSTNQNGQDTSYRGNDIWAYECSASDTCLFSDCIAQNIESYYGNPFGFELIADVQNSFVVRCVADSIIGYSDILGSSLNLPSESYGFRVQRTDQRNYFVDCKARHIQAARRSFGFAAEESFDAIFQNCDAQNIFAYSPMQTKNILMQKEHKVAFGFNAEGSSKTTFIKCTASNISINGEEESDTHTSSIAAGFACNNSDHETNISQSQINNIFSGAGIAAGIYLEPYLKADYSNNIFNNIIATSVWGLGSTIYQILN